MEDTLVARRNGSSFTSRAARRRVAYDARTVSFDLAVWEGPLPISDAAALALFKRLSAEHVGSPPFAPPTEKIRSFLADITKIYPEARDLPYERFDEAVWSDGPLINNAGGPFFYFGIVWTRAKEVAPVVARIAAKHGLVCFDPQSGRRV